MLKQFQWSEIVDDGKPIRCGYCKKFGKVVDMIYVHIEGKNIGVIGHKDRAGCAQTIVANCKKLPPIERGKHRIWWTRKPKIKLVVDNTKNKKIKGE